MNSSRAVDRLQPALLDRLTDDEPDNPGEASDKRVMSKSRLREAVLRDLRWLFNAVSLWGQDDPEQFPHARRSVLNFGLPAFSGTTVSSIDPIKLERLIERAIREHEPRILPDTLRVEMQISEEFLDHHNQVGFRISGQLWAQPVPLELLLHTELDLESGRVELTELKR